MGDIRSSSEAAQRATECLLRGTGGRAVYLRVPAPAATSSIDEELGLAVPEFQYTELAPVVFRRARPEVGKDGERWELLISATSVEDALGDAGLTDASAMFAGAAGVLVDECLMEIEAASSSDMEGMPYVYRVLVRVPQTKTV